MYSEEIVSAINDFANYVHNDQIIILSESDFKSHLLAAIKRKFNDNITVNTESPWYDIYIMHRTYFVDITLFDRDKLKITYDPATKRKGYKYEDEAASIELKFFRHNSDIESIAGDFKKMALLVNMPNNECFIVALARTMDLFNSGKKFMQDQLRSYRNKYNEKVKIYLIGSENLTEIL